MTLSITFYNNIKYTKDDFIARDRDFYGNGVVKLSDFPLEVVGDGSGMQVQLGAGVAWVDGYRIENDAKIPLKLETGSAKARYDIIQIGHDDLNSRAEVKVKKGVAGDIPIEPGADPGYVKLFAIRVNNGVTKVAVGDLLDRRELVPLKVSAAQISFDGALSTAKVGVPNGVASLDAAGKVPQTQIPAPATFGAVADSLLGRPNGVATLNADGKVNTSQLPILNFIPDTQKGQAGGVPTLDASGKIPASQIPTPGTIGAVAQAVLGQPNGVATLGADGKVPTAQLPSLNYVPLSSVGQPGGIASLDASGKVGKAVSADFANSATVSTSAGNADTVDGVHFKTTTGQLQFSTDGTSFTPVTDPNVASKTSNNTFTGTNTFNNTVLLSDGSQAASQSFALMLALIL